MSTTPPEGSDDTADDTAADDTAALLPGSPRAVAHGCRCSTLANAAYRLRVERFGVPVRNVLPGAEWAHVDHPLA